MDSENNSNSDDVLAVDQDDSNSASSIPDVSNSQLDMVKSDVKKEERQRKEGEKLKSINSWVPPIAVPEKILFYIDNSFDKGIGYSFTSSDKNEPNPEAIRNEAIRVYITNKLAIARDTEFAIASVEPGKVKFLSYLTSSIQQLTKSLSLLKCTTQDEVTDYDITPIFNNVLDLINIPEQLMPKVLPPRYVTRIIFVYSNSYISPKVNEIEQSLLSRLKSPYFVFDVLYLHEEQSDFNNVAKIYNDFGQLVSPRSYLLECSRSVKKVFDRMVLLLAHPYQRVNQQSLTLT